MYMSRDTIETLCFIFSILSIFLSLVSILLANRK